MNPSNNDYCMGVCSRLLASLWGSSPEFVSLYLPELCSAVEIGRDSLVIPSNFDVIPTNFLVIP